MTARNSNLTSVDVLEEVNDGSINDGESNTAIDVIDDIGVGIVTGTSQTPLTSNNRRRSSHLYNRENTSSSFISGSEVQHLCYMILAQTKREDYHTTIEFCKRIGWLRQCEEAFVFFNNLE